MNVTNNDLQRLFEDLASELGSPLSYCADRTSRRSDEITAHGSSMVAVGPALKVEVVVHMQISDEEEGPTPWALVFVYINGGRVAPPGLCYMTFSHTLEGRWELRGWEADEYGEWADTETLG